MPEQLVFVDESSCDRRTSYRGRAWAIIGQQEGEQIVTEMIAGTAFNLFFLPSRPCTNFNGIHVFYHFYGLYIHQCIPTGISNMPKF